MLHLICGNYGSFTEDPEFIRHPDNFFDYYFEDEWFTIRLFAVFSLILTI